MTQITARLVVIGALAGNLLVALTKLAAAVVTGSAAMFSEAVHSMVDTANETLLLHGMRRARRRPDLVHPLGYGRELYFWSFIVALLLFGLGAGLSLYRGVDHVLAPEPMAHVAVNYAVLGLAFLFEGISWWIAGLRFNAMRKGRSIWTAFRQSKDPLSFMVLFEDTAALIGIVVAAAGIFAADYFEEPVLDGVASIVIGLILAVTATFLAIESKSLLIGEQAAPSLAESIRELADSNPGVVRTNGVLTVQLSPDQILAALSIEFADELQVPAIERLVTEVEQLIRRQHPEIMVLFVKPQTRQSYRRWRKRLEPDGAS